MSQPVGLHGSIRLLVAAGAAASLLALAGCGGDDSAAVGAESAASIAPASAPLFASVDTDLGSDQWQQVDELLQRFPGRDKLIAELREALAEEDVTTEEIDRAFGPTVDVVALSFEGEGQGVFLTKTDDKAALEALLTKADDPFVIEELDDGWVAFSDEQASIDALKAAQGKDTLADDERFTNALGELPDEALAKLYVNGDAVGDAMTSFNGGGAFPQAGANVEVVSAAVVAEDDGLRTQFYAKMAEGTDAPELGELLEDVPDEVIAFLHFGLGGNEEQLREGVEGAPGARAVLDAFEQQLGVKLEDVTALLRDEVVLYVRPGAVIPEVTLVAKADEQRGRETVDKLLAAATRLTGGQTRQTTVDGLEVTEAVLGPVSLFAASFDGRVVVTTVKQGIEDLRGDGDRLGDDDRYRDALDAAGVGDDEDVFFYVDVDEAYGLAERLAQLAEEPVPDEVRENIEPLRAVVVSGEIGDEESRGSMFLALD